MNTHEQIMNSFLNLPYVDGWDEVCVLFTRIAIGKPYHWLLPVRVCESVGGTLEQAIPAALAIACSHISIILVDDMLDSDPRGEYRQIGAAAAANMACALQAAGLAAIARCQSGPDVKLAALASIDEMILSTALGQYWDIQSPVDEASYWRIVRTKSSPFFGTAFHIGALLGGASLKDAEQLRELGNLYGEMIQIHDDLNDTMAVPANPDWVQERSPLPILFAQLVDHPERARFLELRRDILLPGALAEAQDILIRCGAISYCVDQLLCRCQAAQNRLNTLPLARREALNALLAEMIAPVQRLFSEMGQPLAELVIPGFQTE